MQTSSHEIHKLLRALPSIDRLLGTDEGRALVAEYGRSLTLTALRTTLAETRHAIQNGRTPTITPSALAHATRQWLASLTSPTLIPVINATGVIIHTNLGRAPLSSAALTAIQAVAAGYANLEYDLEAGGRGSRTTHAARLLAELTGAEDALVVNNNAAAVLLMLTALCQGREVIISRGQLVEIGGGFRVPDVMAQSGARLVEVGTTNRTHLRDYEAVIGENTAAILVAHHSNYKIVGFTTEPSLAELAELAHAHNLPLLYDQGSGALLDTTAFGLEAEPTIQASLQAGCDMVTFSGDKLLGGPQAGILVGRSELIAQIKRHPLARAVRADKMCLAGLAATLRPYLTGQAVQEIPVWRMISQTETEIAAVAEQWSRKLTQNNIPAEVIAGVSTVGGGSLPGTTLPTRLVAISHPNVDDLAARLRQNTPPIIGRIQNEQLVLDPRTVLPEQVNALLNGLISHACSK